MNHAEAENLASYYAARAAEYERVYSKPERQADLAVLRATVASYFAGRHVLELACGTGYWTSVYAPAAATVLATDIGAEVLAAARAKPLPLDRVTLHVADAYAPGAIPGIFDACFAGFWWSHVPRGHLPDFLSALHRRLGIGARVMMIDNRYVQGSNTPITRTDAHGNTYQLRSLDDGTEHEVLKNFPSAAEVSEVLVAAGAWDVDVVELPYYWYVTYAVVSRPRLAD